MCFSLSLHKFEITHEHAQISSELTTFHSHFFLLSHFQNDFIPVNRLYDWKRGDRTGRCANTASTGDCCHLHRIATDCNRHRRHKTVCVSLWRRPISIARTSEIFGHIFLAVLHVNKCRLAAVDYHHTIAARKTLFRRAELFFASLWRTGTFDGCVDWSVDYDWHKRCYRVCVYNSNYLRF